MQMIYISFAGAQCLCINRQRVAYILITQLKVKTPFLLII